MLSSVDVAGGGPERPVDVDLDKDYITFSQKHPQISVVFRGINYSTFLHNITNPSTL